MNAPPELTCPKCDGPMRTYARNGITIDQCTVCHGNLPRPRRAGAPDHR
jgi:hypothetical protein